MIFGTLICTDLRLICAPQITANQASPTFKKHCKTQANQRKSLQITSLKNHRKNDADLQPRGAVTPRGCGAHPPKLVAKATTPPGLDQLGAYNSSYAVNKLTSALSVTWAARLGDGKRKI